MNASVAWLNTFLEKPATAAEMRDLLTAHTATVEEMVSLREDLAPIVIARVVEEGLHPDSDHLHVTKVDAGTGELLDVVCGAPNVTAGKMYPFAPTGTVMPNGLKIEKRKIRGQTSNGMLCSARELLLGEEHDGIMELDLDVAPGTPFLKAVEVGDTRLVVDVLPNRPDLLSHWGLAREIAAVRGHGWSLPEIDVPGINIPEAKHFRRAGNAGGVVIHLENAKLASRYVGAIVRGVRVGPSPGWLVERLASVGARSINNIVDATNFVLHEVGQPIHAFDLNKLDPEPKMPEKTVVVRSAKDGETLVTLDGVTRTLTAEMSVIADSVNPIALAGVMGGQSTEVDDTTTDLFVEVANFDTAATRRTRRGAGLSTDASYRFERGVDPNVVGYAMHRVLGLIITLAGGSVETEPVVIGAGETQATPIVLRVNRVARVLGVSLDPHEIMRLLWSIMCEATLEDDNHSLRVIPPSWRRDLVAEVNLIEEVARLHGYDALPNEIRAYRPGNSHDAPLWTLSEKLRSQLSAAGFLEAKPMPFVAGTEAHVALVNPLADNEGRLRQTLMETLAPRAEHNLAHMVGNVRLYEIGSAFAKGDSDLPVETMRVAVLMMGDREPTHFTNPKPAQYDAWDAKGLGEGLARFIWGDATLEDASDESILWNVVAGGATRGVITRVTLDAPVWASPAFGVELVIDAMPNNDIAPPGEHAHSDDRTPAPPRAATKYRPLPVMPASEFDLALLVPDGVSAAQVESTIRDAAGDLLERLVAFDVYEGSGIESGYRSVAWRLTLRHPERTLRDKEIEGRRAKILGSLKSGLGVQTR